MKLAAKYYVALSKAKLKQLHYMYLYKFCTP